MAAERLTEAWSITPIEKPSRIVDQLRLQVADLLRLSLRSTTTCGQPPRSIATTSSVSSIGVIE